MSNVCVIYPTHIYTYYLIFLIFELRHKMMIPCFAFIYSFHASLSLGLHLIGPIGWRGRHKPESPGSPCPKDAPKRRHEFRPPPKMIRSVVIRTQQWSNDSNDALGCTMLEYGVFLWYVLMISYGSPIGEALTQNFATKKDIKWIQKAPPCDPNGYWLQHTS